MYLSYLFLIIMPLNLGHNVIILYLINLLKYYFIIYKNY